MESRNCKRSGLYVVIQFRDGHGQGWWHERHREEKKAISSEGKTQRLFVCSFFSIDLMLEIKEIDEAKMILQISGLSN